MSDTTPPPDGALTPPTPTGSEIDQDAATPPMQRRSHTKSITPVRKRHNKKDFSKSKSISRSRSRSMSSTSSKSTTSRSQSDSESSSTVTGSASSYTTSSDSESSKYSRGRRKKSRQKSRRRSLSTSSVTDEDDDKHHHHRSRRSHKKRIDHKKQKSRISRSKTGEKLTGDKKIQDDQAMTTIDGKAGEILPSTGNTAAILNQGVRPGRTGGVYVPPFKLARLKAQIKDHSSEQYQRLAWDELRKGINGVVNKVNITNMTEILPELFKHNIVRGRGLLARSVMKAQMASPGFTHIYAALIAVINTRMPENGELLLKRVVIQFRRSYRRNDKIVAVALAKFIAHLVNQQVAHEIISLQMLTLLLERPTDSSVEVAVDFVKECGQLLLELTPQGLHAIFERFRSILHEGTIDKRVQFMIESLFAVRKSGFADYPRILPELDLVESDDQITHEIGLDDELEKEEMLDIFRYDPKFDENEAMWKQIKTEILGESDVDESDGASVTSSESEEEVSQTAIQTPQTQVIEDKTETDVVTLRRTIYLTIMSSLDFEECAHKLLKLQVPEHLESEIINMLIECCAQERTYMKYFGLLGQRFCFIKPSYQEGFEIAFAKQYSTIHRLDTGKLRNVAKFFAHLLSTDALPWTVFEFIRLNEDETNSSSRIFLKILLQELMQNVGIKQLKERFRDPHMSEIFAGLFPKDNPRNARFAINYFTSIGLGALTDDLRAWLRDAPKLLLQQQQAALAAQKAHSETESDASSVSSRSRSGSRSSFSGSSSRSRSVSGSPSSVGSRSRSISRSPSPSLGSRRRRSMSHSSRSRSVSHSSRSRSLTPHKSIPPSRKRQKSRSVSKSSRHSSDSIEEGAIHETADETKKYSHGSKRHRVSDKHFIFNKHHDEDKHVTKQKVKVENKSDRRSNSRESRHSHISNHNSNRSLSPDRRNTRNRTRSVSPNHDDTEVIGITKTKTEPVLEFCDRKASNTGAKTEPVHTNGRQDGPSPFGRPRHVSSPRRRRRMSSRTPSPPSQRQLRESHATK